MRSGSEADERLARRLVAVLTAVAAILAAVALRWTLLAPLGDGLPYITLYPVLIAIVLRRGVPLAATAAVLGLVLVEAVGPRAAADPATWQTATGIRLLTYGLVVSAVLVWGRAMRRSRRRLAASQRHAAELAIGEARSAQAAAAASAHVAAIVQHASDAIVACNVDGLVTAWNDAAERTFGYAAEEILGRHVSSLALPEEVPAQEAVIARVLAGETVTQETCRMDKAGRPVTVRISVAPMPSPDGHVLGLCAVIQDIGERKRTEEALRQSEATLRAFYEHTPVCMGVVEPTGGDDILHIYDNRVACALFGVPPGATTYRLSSSLGAPRETRQRWLTHYAHSARIGGPVHFEYTIGQGPDMRWLTATVAPIGKGPTGRDRFCYVSEDVTERHRAARRLAQSEARSRLALEVAGIGTWSWNRATDGVEADARCREIAGLPLQGALALSAMQARIVPDDWPRVRATLESAVLDGGHGAYFEEFRFLHPDGTVRWVLSRGQVMQEDTGGMGTSETVLMGTVLDITERREAELKLVDADRRKDEFLAVLAHELRNPMAPLVTGVEILRRMGAHAEHRDKAVAMMDRQARHLVKLVNDLLDLSRISQGRLDLRKKNLALQEVLDSAVETARPMLEAAGHTLAVLPVPPTLRITGDLTRLSQVFANLLNNAAKYTPAGGTVSVSVEAHDGVAAVAVSDTGVGIAPDMLSRVFDMFAQVDMQSDAARDGLGIGLAIARRLVEMHGGAIEAHSRGLGRGSTFVVRLPLAAVAEVAPEGPVQVAAGRRVLVVDDNVDAAMSLAQLLMLSGHVSHVAHDGRQALEEVAAFCPDVVLMDLGMPGLSGYETARLLRARYGGQRPVLVAVTGWGQAEDQRRAAEAGFDAHLVKPVSLQDVESAWTGAMSRAAEQVVAG